MSIINQALRDLDARQAAHPRVSAPLPTAASAVGRGRRYWIASAFALMLIGGLVIALMSGRGPDQLVPPKLVVSPHASVAPQHDVPVPIAPLAVESTATPPPSIDKQVSVARVEPQPATPAETVAPRKEALPASKSGERSLALQSLKLSDTVTSPPVIHKEINSQSVEEGAEERYRKAITLIQKGRENQARLLLEESIGLFPGHVAARQTLATLLSEAGHGSDAEAVLREGRRLNQENAWFALNLARLQIARGDIDGAAANLQSGIAGRGVNAEYRATYAALLARLKQPAEAARQYEFALKQQPEEGAWWMGLGLALTAQGKPEEARMAYSRALEAGNLPSKLEEFVRSKLAGP